VYDAVNQEAPDDTEQIHTQPNGIAGHLSLILETVNAFIFAYDAGLKLTFINDRLLKHFGYEPGQIIGKNIVDFIIEADRERVRNHFSNSLARDESISCDITFALKNGDQRILRANAAAIINNDQIQGGVVIAEDITEFKKNQENLQESVDQLRHVVDNMLDMVAQIDLNGKFTYISSSHKRNLGYEPEEMLGKSFYGFLHPDEKKQVSQMMIKALRDKSEDRIEHRVRCKNGQYRWFETMVNSMLDGNGMSCGGIFASRDISMGKLASQDLKETQQRMTDIIAFLPDATFVIDLKGRVIAWNQAMEQMTDIKASEILGKGNYEYSLPFYGERRPVLIDLVLHPDDDKAQKDYDLLQRNEHNLVGASLCPGLGETGQYMWATASALYNTGGQMTGAIESVRNITDKRNDELELKKSNATLHNIMDGVVNALAITSEKRDPYTAGHQRRVANLACAIAREMGIGEEPLENIRIASILHDLGKMFIPNDILSKPGDLNYIEMLMIKTHPQAAYDILKTIDFRPSISKAILQHHERLDGSGYPNGLTDSEIILEARIIAVADVVEAMASHRPYRPALGLDYALAEINQNQGRLFDAEVVQTCTKLFMEKEFWFE